MLILTGSAAAALALAQPAAADDGDGAAFLAVPPLTWPNGAPRPAPKPAPGRWPGVTLDIAVPPVPAALPAPAAFSPLEAQLPPAPLKPGETALTAPGRPLPLALRPGGNMTLAPTLNFGTATANPNDPRIAAPTAQHLNPTPGLDASVDLGDVTVDTILNRPINRNVDNLISPDGKPAGVQPNMGVDLKLKF